MSIDAWATCQYSGPMNFQTSLFTRTGLWLWQIRFAAAALV